MTQKFIIVDDDPISNMLCRIVIEDVFPEAGIEEYTDPETALDDIRSTYANAGNPHTVLLLDINMPTLTGWEFLEAFEQFDISIKEKLRVYMLSSSVDPRDRERAGSNKNVSDYFEKPLTKETAMRLAV